MFQSNAALNYAGGGAFVDDLVLEVTPSACPNAATIRGITLDRSCYVPGAQMGVLVNATTTRSSQQVRARALLLSGDVGIASGEVTFAAPGQRVIPLVIPAGASTGDYTILVNLYDVASDCIEDVMTKPTRIDPACRATDVIPVTHTPHPTPTPTATMCPAAGTGTYITTDDNENNAHSGTADNDMYPGTETCLENTDPVAPIEFNIYVASLPTFSTARLLLYAFDVDEQDGEVDEVYFNGTRVGTLTGYDDIWSTTVLPIAPGLVRAGNNLVEIRIDVNNDPLNDWCTKVDWGQLVLDRGGGAASLPTAGVRPASCRKSGDTVMIDYGVTTRLSSQQVRVEVNILGANYATIAASSRTFVVTNGQTTSQSETLILPTGLPPGTYTVTIIVFDTCSATQQDMWTGTITIQTCGAPTYTPTRPPTHTPSPTPSPTHVPCMTPRPEFPPSCSTSGFNYVRNASFEKGDRSWGTYHTGGRSIIGTQRVREGFFAANFEGRLGQASRQVLFEFIDIPLDATDASFFVKDLVRYGSKVDPAGPLSGRDYFRVSIYDWTLSTELVRMAQFDPLSQCDPDPFAYNFGPVDLARVRGRTVALVFEFVKVTLGGWYGGVTLDGVHLNVCSPSPPCLVSGDKTASPSVTTPGGEVTVMLSLTGYGGACLPARRSPDVMLVVDRSGSMSGTPMEDAKAASMAFVDRLDLSTDQVGLVSFATTADLDQPLQSTAGPVRATIAALVASGDTNINDALILAQAELISARHRATNQPVIVLLSDGRPTTGGDPLAAAAAAKQAGTRIYTIGLGSGVDPDLMRALASAPSDYFFAADSTQLGAVYEQIAGVISGAPATNVVLVDELSPYVTLVPNSFTGSPLPEVSPDSRTLTWRLPRLGIETRRFSYRVKMTMQPGTWPTNNSAIATFTNSLGQPGALTLPVPQVTVRQPPPTAEPYTPPQSGHPQLMCRDHVKDFGAVPSNPNDEAWWDSPDIWVRNQPDAVEEPQFPLAGQTNYVYVRVRNSGNTGLADIKVHVYSSRGSASIVWPDDWAPEIGVATVPSLAAGETKVVSVPWTPVVSGHYCFLARLEAPYDPITQDGWVPFDNNICQRNVQILDPPTASGGAGPNTNTGTGFGNRKRGSGYGSAKVRSQNFPGSGTGTVRFANPALFDRWQQAGGTVTGGTVNTAQKSIQLNVGQSGGGQGAGKVDLKIDRVPFEGEETSQLLFDLTLPSGSNVPTLEVTQYDETGSAVGGTIIRQAGRTAPLYLPSLPHGPGLGDRPRLSSLWRRTTADRSSPNTR